MTNVRARVVLGLLLAMLTVGCTRELDLGSGTGTDASTTDAMVLRDASDDARNPPEDASAEDAPSDDARIDARLDASSPSDCPIRVDGDTLALFSMEEVAAGMLVDVAGGHAATLTSAGPDVNGPAGCGKALQGNASRIGIIPLHDDWKQLGTGSFDLFVRVDTLPTDSGSAQIFFSRDAKDQLSPGQFILGFDKQGKVVLRFQGPSGTETRYYCSAPDQPLGSWIHVGVNFGAPRVELYVDGQLTPNTGIHYKHGDGGSSCETADIDEGLDENANPWVIGASTMNSEEGSHEPINKPFSSLVDQVRISTARRDFTAFVPR